jgi:hypothetical protein
MSTRDETFQPSTHPTRHQAAFEETRVLMLLTAFGLVDLKWELLNAHAAEFGTRRLTFAGFRRRFPTFPVLLDARYVGRLCERIALADLFRRFGRLFIHDLYLEAYARHEEVAAGRPVALVIPFDGLRSGLVLHNGAFRAGGTRVVHETAGNAPPHRLAAEPYSAVLKYLAAGSWSPDGPAPATLPVAQHTPLAAAVAPWMVRWLGSGPAVLILGWLHAVLDAETPAGRKWVRRGDQCDRFVRASQDEIAAETGLSGAAVKRGLDRLRMEGLILATRGDRATDIVVVPRDEL